MRYTPFFISVVFLVLFALIPNTFGQTPVQTLIGHTASVKNVVFSPNEGILATGSQDKTVRLWDARTGRHIRTITGHTRMVRSVVFSPNGQTLATGSKDKTVRLWDAKNR